jgi:hypothetical protein
MMAPVRKFVPPILLVLVSVIGGWQVTYLIDMIPSDMPYAVDKLIRLGLSVTGHKELANPDDMFVLALFLYWIVSAVVIGIVLHLAWSAIRKQINPPGIGRGDRADA